MKRSRNIRRLTVAILLFIAGVVTVQVYQAGVRYGERLGRENYFERVVMAIYEVEGADRAAVPFGIGSVKCDGYADCKRVAYNTVKNNWSRWEAAGRPGPFTEFLAKRYCPHRWAWWARALEGRL